MQRQYYTKMTSVKITFPNGTKDKTRNILESNFQKPRSFKLHSVFHSAPQVVVGILFLVIGGLNINDDDDQSTANIINDIIVITIFLVTLINIIISGFGIRTTDTSVADHMLAAKLQKES